MPIKFACPKCKNVISVDEKLAGKRGKCKCGATIQIPSPKSAAAAPAKTLPASSAMGAVFDELTEADYNRRPAGQKVRVPQQSTESKLENLPGSGMGKQPASRKARLKKIGWWQWGLIIIFSSVITNVIVMQVQGPMEDTAASRGQALGRGVASALGIVIGVAFIIVHFVRRKKK
jgi:hypothetical protein